MCMAQHRPGRESNMADLAANKRLRMLGAHLKSPNTRNELSRPPRSFVSSDNTVSSPYSFDNGVLTPEQRRFYDENGFFVVPKLVKPSNMEKYVGRFRDICSGKVPRSAGMVVMKDVSITQSEFVKGEKAVNKIQDYQYDEVLFEYCSLPQIVKYVECFTGPDIMAFHTMLINKPPDSGAKTSRHPLHQDLHYFNFRPADRIVCSWTALEKVNRDNGCLVVLPGSHRRGVLLPHVYPEWEGGVNKMYHGIQDFDPNAPRTHLEMEAGDTVFFHPLLIHGSGMNRTQRFRKAISCHYGSSHVYFIDVKGTHQENIENEVAEIVRKRVGPDFHIDLEFAWRIRARHIKGQEMPP